jgi:hypothetical protein
VGCSALQADISLPTFQRSVLPPSSGRWVRRARGTVEIKGEWDKAEVRGQPSCGGSTDLWNVGLYQSARRYNPEDSHQLYR